MSTKMTKNGITTTNASGQEQYETFTTGRGRNRKTLVQYDYRHTNGVLFSCIKKTLGMCRAARDAWIAGGAQ